MDEIVAKIFERQHTPKSPPGLMYAESDMSQFDPGMPTGKPCPNCDCVNWDELSPGTKDVDGDELEIECLSCGWAGKYEDLEDQ